MLARSGKPAIDEAAQDAQVACACVHLHAVASRPEPGTVADDLQAPNRARAARPDVHRVAVRVVQLDTHEIQIHGGAAAPGVAHVDHGAREDASDDTRRGLTCRLVRIAAARGDDQQGREHGGTTKSAAPSTTHSRSVGAVGAGDLIRGREGTIRSARVLDGPMRDRSLVERNLTRGPIFVVGPSRSGTSMVREMLNRNSAVWITRETHYFDDLRQRSATRDEIEAYFARIGAAAYGASTDDAEGHRESLRLREAAATLGATPDAYFESFCRLRAEDQGRPHWGEKTPRHVMQVARMLELYPDAKIVCLVRDPRAVVASYRDWTRRAALSPDRDSAFAADRSRARSSYGLLLSSLMCAASLRAGIRALREFGPERVRLLRFEELVQAPRETLVDLCDWLDLPFTDAMIDVPLVQSSYDGSVRQGVSTEPVERWRTKLSTQEVGVIELACSRVMRELGYKRTSSGRAWRSLAGAALSLPPDVLRAARVNRPRISKPLSYAWRRLSLSLGSR